MEGIHSHRATGYTCHMCGDAAIVDFGGAYFCASRAAKARITVDLRAEEPTVTVSQS